ncbi:Uncharacterised protein [Actinobacillus porcinus]|uniref:EpsG family protein n=1 Tax=Actinobacillus porcinus TaxID=51048 RepID=A0ABY6TIY0_9PAST|nr:EpsG family protein [Actinobacillus porcinus]VFY92887.1 Uncharacterised protein [Actinobacillus porcinus]VTU07522.1 Uncharacterised protein [Actinobacillus porcinus]
MEIYILCCFISCFFGYLAKGRLRYFFIFLSLIPPLIVSSLRYDNGADYLMYEDMFHSIYTYGSYESVKSIEVGFLYLIELISILSNNTIIYFGIIALVILFFYYHGILSISKSVPLSIFLFFITGTFFDTFNGLRQYIAASIIFWSFKYIIKEDIRKYLLSIFLAFLFHYTAIVALPIYWIVRKKYSSKLILTVILFFMLANNLIENTFYTLLSMTRYSFYLGSEELVVVPTVSSIIYTSIVGCLGIYFYRVYNSVLSKRFIILFNLQVIAWITALLSLSIPLASRWQYYFVPVSILFIPELIYLSKYRFNKILIISIIFIMYISTLFYGVLYNGWFGAYPYNLINL